MSMQGTQKSIVGRSNKIPISAFGMSLRAMAGSW